MRLQSLPFTVAIGAGSFLSYIQLVVTAAAAAVALPVQAEEVGTSSSSPQILVVARGGGGGSSGGGSSVEGGYYNLCHYYPTIGEIEGQIHMTGQCASKQDGPLRNTWMNLSPCYANINGTLFPVTDGKGDFHSTCKGCRIPIGIDDAKKLPPKWMRCTCERYAGDKEGRETEVDMDQHIHVFEDKLGCPGAEGFMA